MAKPENSIKKIKLPGESTARDIIPDSLGSGSYIASLPTLSADATLVTDNIAKANSVFNAPALSFTEGSSTAGSRKSVRWYCSGINNGISNITEPYDGMKVMVKIPKAGLTTVGAVLSINADVDANYHPVAYNVSTVFTSHFTVGSFKILVYNASAKMNAYITTDTVTEITGVWQCESDYDSNTDTKVRQYQAGTTARTGKEYPILTRYNTTDKSGSYDATYARFNTDAYINTTTGYIYAPKLYSNAKEVATQEYVNTAIDNLPYATTADIQGLFTS